MDINTLELTQKVEELSKALLEKHPRMPVLLKEIHTTVHKYPEQVTLLNEDQIAVIVSGLLAQTNSELAAIVTKTSKSSSSSASKSLMSKLKGGNFNF